MNIRKFNDKDTEEIMQLFYDTVHNINIRDYTQEQVNAWAPQDMDYQHWNERLNSKMTYVAEIDEKIVGFAQLEANGHIDCFYCHNDFQGMGIGARLLDAIQRKAEELGINRLFTEASITARGFFERKGFTEIKKQEVELRGMKFINFCMAKEI